MTELLRECRRYVERHDSGSAAGLLGRIDAALATPTPCLGHPCREGARCPPCAPVGQMQADAWLDKVWGKLADAPEVGQMQADARLDADALGCKAREALAEAVTLAKEAPDDR